MESRIGGLEFDSSREFIVLLLRMLDFRAVPWCY
uniref:Uncharacterized protein n=1 Tax=Arundo donax TaxID=35708 RepID=A0A0A9BWP5_ARUDO